MKIKFKVSAVYSLSGLFAWKSQDMKLNRISKSAEKLRPTFDLGGRSPQVLNCVIRNKEAKLVGHQMQDTRIIERRLSTKVSGSGSTPDGQLKKSQSPSKINEDRTQALVYKIRNLICSTPTRNAPKGIGNQKQNPIIDDLTVSQSSTENILKTHPSELDSNLVPWSSQ